MGFVVRSSWQIARRVPTRLVKAWQPPSKPTTSLRHPLPLAAALEHGGVTLWHIEPRVPIPRATVDRCENRLQRVGDGAEILGPGRAAVRDMQIERQRRPGQSTLERRQIVAHSLAEHFDMLGLVVEDGLTPARAWRKATV